MRDRRAFLLVNHEQYSQLLSKTFSKPDTGVALGQAIDEVFGERFHQYLGRRYGPRGTIHIRVTSWS